MLTKHEITALNLSPTKKDFVQIWNELLDVAGKLSERWDPTSTNESDPGIVILKALTGIADKLNYNIDKNILEAFMPTAAQEESMRKLCDMLGYNIKYYRSAETTVNIKYYNANPDEKEQDALKEGLYIPKFTSIMNSDQDAHYFILSRGGKSEYRITSDSAMLAEVPCMEGQIVKCESSSDNNVITINQLSENNKFYLPETQIAENGIFIYNVTTGLDTTTLVDGEEWKKVDNLNVCARGSRVFKFGFDSYESRPYIAFPEDCSELFGEGLFIYYARTNGVNGNVSAGTLTQIELPTSNEWANVSAESFSVENVFAATTGANPESIGQAYNNFKKTIGTFETLVTCRDYMNRIYSFIENGKPLVSNILVTDIRDDINKAVTICTGDNMGIFYKDIPLTEQVVKALKVNGSDEVVEVVDTVPLLNHFDLVFYPFKSYNQVRSNVKDIRTVYDASFDYTEAAMDSIKPRLAAEEIKTISHNIKTPDKGDILSINNYLRLSMTIATNSKVTVDESAVIIDNIKKALANAFNMRELDFGDEIPFDSIVEVIENADTRIRVASLNEPALYTTFSVLEEKDSKTPIITEYAVASDWLDLETADKTGRFTKIVREEDATGKQVERTVSTFDTVEARKIYNKLAVRNILAGRVPLFNYNKTFSTSFSEGAYSITNTSDKPLQLAEPTAENPYTIWVDPETNITYTGRLDTDGEPTYTKTFSVIDNNIIAEDKSEDGKIDNYITGIEAQCKIKADNHGVIAGVTLADGEFVKFRAPNFTTKKTYPAYVNYYLDLAGETKTEAKPAIVESFYNVLNSDYSEYGKKTTINWQRVLNYFGSVDDKAPAADGDPYKKTFAVTQTISAYNVPTDENTSAQTDEDDKFKDGKLIISPAASSVVETSATEYLAKSGCVKLISPVAKTYWSPVGEEIEPESEEPPKIPPIEFQNHPGNPFITNIADIASLSDTVDAYIGLNRDQFPTSCSWTVEFEFECVPFEARSLSKWEAFIEDCINNYNTDDLDYQIFKSSVGDFTAFRPVVEDNTILWRLFGEGYTVGKFVTLDTQKLLKFDASYFGLLPESPLTGVYLAKSLGEDSVPRVIKNNEEYALGRYERLYIEYTPSSTAEDSASSATSVTEIHGEGTVIRPSGFETGLMDSSTTSVSSYKKATFEREGVREEKNMQRFGANEQVEIRDFAEVTLSYDKDKLPAIYVYKNFNGCPELENKAGNANGSRKYTLKDGEAIFYTDQNKAEFAYYTNGTEVELSGNMTIGEFEVIELSTIFDSGIQAIPWARKNLADGDKITFREYQYITLGQEDSLQNLKIVQPANTESTDTYTTECLDSTWKYCSDVEYVIAAEPDKTVVLPAISVPGRAGSGWEACSLLELNVSPDIAQTLRTTDKVETSIKLTRTKTTGGIDYSANNDSLPPLSDIPTDAEKPSLSFKTNLACQAHGNKIDIDEVLYNPEKLKSFQIKVFSKEAPAVVKTKPGKVVPNEDVSLLAWTGDTDLVDLKEALEVWNQVALEDIRTTNNYDSALRLPVSLLPNTYGVFCIYVDYSNDSTDTLPETWIEAAPGTRATDITILNTKISRVETSDGTFKLYLNPGINCIRVNRTGRIFIKASNNAAGILYFDDIQLVDCQPINYIDSDNTPVVINTQGLNLKQLGYLSTSNAEEDHISSATKTKLQKAYTDEMLSKVTSIVQKTDADFIAKYTELVELAPKLSELVEVEKLIQAELKHIKNIDDDRLKELVGQYEAVQARLENEKALLTALNNNAKAEEISQKLITLLDGFVSIENAQQQILDELAKLNASAKASLKDISEEDILADFTTAPQDTRALSEIKTIVLDKIEELYQERLTAVAESLNRSANSTSKNTMLTILDNLKASATSTLRAELQTKANTLANLIETSEVDSLIEQIVDVTYYDSTEPEGDATIDFQQLLTLLAQLRNVFDSNYISILISEITAAVSASNDAHLATLLSPLFADNGSFNNDALNNQLNNQENQSLLTAISDVEEYTKKEIDANYSEDAKIADVRSKVDKLKDAVFTDYTSKLKNTFTVLKEILDNIVDETSYIDDILADVNDTEYTEATSDSQVQLATKQLKSAIKERKDYIKAAAELTRDNWKTNNCQEKGFVSAAIISVWPAFINTRLLDLLENISNKFMESLDNKSSDSGKTDLDSFEASKAALISIYSPETATMKSILPLKSTESFETLFDKIKPLLATSSQNTIDAALISKISGLLESAELASAIQAASGSNAIIQMLSTEWQNEDIDIKQKHKIQAQLKAELTEDVNTLEQLLSIVVNMLCPTIAENINKVDENDSFYGNLYTKLTELQQSILNKDIIAISIPVDSAYLELLELPVAEFKIALSSFTTPAETLVPDAIKDALSALNDFLDGLTKQLEDKAVLDQQVLEAMSSVELRALVVTDQEIRGCIETLSTKIESLEHLALVDVNYEEAFKTLELEDQLLEEIRAIDTDRKFYYNFPIETSLAIDFNESFSDQNTLMNPQLNYDINNVNNRFVISKLDIDFLDNGIQIARSSKLI